MMKKHSAAAAAAALLLGFAAHAQAANITITPDQVTQSGFSPIYLGVDYETATVPSNPTSTGAATTSRAYISRIDLKAPGVGVITTGHSGTAETTSETISQFAARTRVRFAINGNFFAPCCDHFAEPKTLTGLEVSNGQVVAPASNVAGQSNVVLAFMKNGKAVIDLSQNINVAQVQNAVAGSAMIVQNGKDISATSPNEGDPNDPNPRTLVGLSNNGRYLYIVIVDGRFTGYSTGTTNQQSAALMQAIGCDVALNLDGGGSSEIVRADTLGKPYILNVPSDSEERFDAVGLGIYADPLPQLPFE